jgi:hypothetical protein
MTTSIVTRCWGNVAAGGMPTGCAKVQKCENAPTEDQDHASAKDLVLLGEDATDGSRGPRKREDRAGPICTT